MRRFSLAHLTVLSLKPPAMIEVAETRLRLHGLPLPKMGQPQPWSAPISIPVVRRLAKKFGLRTNGPAINLLNCCWRP